MIETLLIAGFTGIVSSIVTITAIKVDIAWIKRIIDQHNHRLIKLEDKTHA